jgi:hypothetical protein
VPENNALEYSNVPKTIEESRTVKVKGEAANKAIK